MKLTILLVLFGIAVAAYGDDNFVLDDEHQIIVAKLSTNPLAPFLEPVEYQTLAYIFSPVATECRTEESFSQQLCNRQFKQVVSLLGAHGVTVTQADVMRVEFFRAIRLAETIYEAKGKEISANASNVERSQRREAQAKAWEFNKAPMQRLKAFSAKKGVGRG